VNGRIEFSTTGWYIVRVDTSIGEQYTAIEIEQLGDIDRVTSHYKELVFGPEVTAEAAWSGWRTSLPSGHAFGAKK
jgi:hypothetical protein